MPLPTPGVIPGPEIKIPLYPILARDVVKHVGDSIAFVVADTVERAKDAAEAIAIDWTELPHVIGAMEALKPGAPQVWPDRPNLSFETAMGTGAQLTTFYADLTGERRAKWRRLFHLYNELGLASAEYVNLYDIAFDKPEVHVVRKGADLYYGIFADVWGKNRRIELRGLDKALWLLEAHLAG